MDPVSYVDAIRHATSSDLACVLGAVRGAPPSPHWLNSPTEVGRALEAHRAGCMEDLTLMGSTKKSGDYAITNVRRLGLVPHRDGAVSMMILDLDAHDRDAEPVPVESTHRYGRWLGASPVVFRSKGGKGLHLTWLLRRPIPIDRFLAWSRAWGFNRKGRDELFPKTAKRTAVWLPSDHNPGTGGDRYECGVFDEATIAPATLPARPSVSLTNATLDFLQGMIPAGSRNDALNKAAFELAAKRVEPGLSWDFCARGAQLCGLAGNEIRSTFESGYEAGRAAPGRIGREDSRSSGRPTIRLSPRENEVTDAALEALSRAPDVFQRGGELVCVVVGGKPPRAVVRPQASPRIVKLPLARLRETLSREADFMRLKSDEWTSVRPPEWVVGACEGRREWPMIRPLEGVVECPVLVGDGRILAARVVTTTRRPACCTTRIGSSPPFRIVPLARVRSSRRIDCSESWLTFRSSGRRTSPHGWRPF